MPIIELCLIWSVNQGERERGREGERESIFSSLGFTCIHKSNFRDVFLLFMVTWLQFRFAPYPMYYLLLNIGLKLWIITKKILLNANLKLKCYTVRYTMCLFMAAGCVQIQNVLAIACLITSNQFHSVTHTPSTRTNYNINDRRCNV